MIIVNFSVNVPLDISFMLGIVSCFLYKTGPVRTEKRKTSMFIQSFDLVSHSISFIYQLFPFH